MYHAPSLRIRSIVAAITIAVLATSCCAFAQWRTPQKTSGFALSYAYQGSSTNGFRLEMSQNEFVADAGWFNSSDGDVYCLEVGMNPTGMIGGYDAIPFMVGIGGYQLNSDVAGVDDSATFNFWAGVGTFDHTSSGLFFQYRHIFGGHLSGSQGIVGWAF